MTDLMGGTPEPQDWPASGPAFNRWNDDVAAFVKLVQDNPGFWLSDFQLKYLDIRIDTRDGGFVLKDRDGEKISPDRVVSAIKQHQARFGSSQAQGSATHD